LNLAPTRKEFPPKAQSEKYKKYEIIFQAKDNIRSHNDVVINM
jgi:hypothetical protein